MNARTTQAGSPSTEASPKMGGRWGARIVAHPLALAAGALILALALRVAYLLFTRHSGLGIDERSYNSLGRTLAAGHGWAAGDSAYRPPGMPFLLAGVYAVLGPPSYVVPRGDYMTVRLVLAVLSVVNVALIGAVARELTNARVAIVALFVAAVYWPLILVGDSLLSEALLVPLSLAASLTALLSRRKGRRYRWICLTGFLCGLAALTRGNGLIIAPALACVVWVGRPRGWLRSLTAPVALLAVTALTIAPWTIRNAIAQHAFIPVTDEFGATLAGAYNSTAASHHFMWTAGYLYPEYQRLREDRKLPEAVRSKRLISAVGAYIGRHPLEVPATMAWNTVRLVDLEGRFISRRSARGDLRAPGTFADLAVYTFWVVGLLAVVGLCLRTHRSRIPRSIWLVPILIWLSVIPANGGTPRFRAPLDPWIILLAAVGLQAAGSRLLAMRSGRTPRAGEGALAGKVA